ncbi:MAG: acyl-CoA thioesterase [Muribaculaceae bacterium]|nr:acyl-CoA thioesterase [Muribaculaceae bacterium]
MKPLDIPACPNPKVPVSAYPFHFSLDAQLRFNDVDIFGHINNSVYLQLFDLAKVRYFEAVLGGPVDWHEATVVVVNINASFYSPAYFDEPLRVVTTVGKISVHSFVLEQRIYNTETGDVKSTASTVMAGFDPSTATGIPVPEKWVKSLMDFENRAE